MSNCTEVLIYDKDNKQIGYQYMARDLVSGKLVIGNVVVEQPWYQPKHYFIYFNEYKSGGFCGGAINLGLKRVEVNPNTIVPFTQLAKIKWNQENGIRTKIDEIKQSMRGSTTVEVTDSFPRFGIIEEIYGRKGIEEVEIAVGKFGDNHFSKNKEYKFNRKENFQSFSCRLIEEQKNRRRNDLYKAIIEFWNKNKEQYSAVVVGVEYDNCEYIEENAGKYTSSMLSEEYDSMEELLMDFVYCIDPNKVVGFNLGRKRNSERVVNNGTNLPF